MQLNVKQLKTAKTEVKAGNNVTVDTTYGNDGHTIYTVNANDVALGDAVLKYSANGTNTQSVKLSQGLTSLTVTTHLLPLMQMVKLNTT